MTVGTKLTRLEAEVLYLAASEIADHSDARDSAGMVGPRGAALDRAMTKLRRLMFRLDAGREADLADV